MPPSAKLLSNSPIFNRISFRKKYMITIQHLDKQFLLRPVESADIPALRKLVNAAYEELSAMGLNYTATYQDENITKERISKGRAFVLTEDKKIIATILLSQLNYFTHKNTAYISQFAVTPAYKKKGIGTLLMDYCEQLAKEEHFEAIQLDTAIPANHLVKWYLKRGYEIIGEIQWEEKTYKSYIFEKKLNLL